MPSQNDHPAFVFKEYGNYTHAIHWHWQTLLLQKPICFGLTVALIFS